MMGEIGDCYLGDAFAVLVDEVAVHAKCRDMGIGCLSAFRHWLVV